MFLKWEDFRGIAFLIMGSQQKKVQGKFAFLIKTVHVIPKNCHNIDILMRSLEDRTYKP